MDGLINALAFPGLEGACSSAGPHHLNEGSWDVKVLEELSLVRNNLPWFYFPDSSFSTSVPHIQSCFSSSMPCLLL